MGWGKIMLWADVAFNVCAVYKSLAFSSETSLLTVAMWWIPLFMANIGRMKQNAHGIGHFSLMSPAETHIAELIFIMLGPVSMLAYSGSDNINMRHQINERREIASSEFTGMRGPYEHQALHHVRGASLEHDACALAANQGGWFRLSSDRQWKPHHKLQTNPLYVNLVEMAFMLFTVVFMFAPRIIMLKVYLKEGGEPTYVATHIIGILVAMATSRFFVLPLWMGPLGIALWVGAVMTITYLALHPMGFLFFAQHMWDRHTDEDKVDEDWGYC